MPPLNSLALPCISETDYLASIIETQQQVLTASLDLERVMAVIVDRTQLLTNAHASVVEILEGDEMVYRAANGRATPFIGLRLKASDSLSGWCVRTAEIINCPDSETDDRVNREACRKVGVRSMIVVPLLHEGTAVGVLKVLSSEPNAFAQGDVKTLQLMSGLLSGAIAQATAYEDLRNARETAVEASRLKSEFLANMSHEIRTPMNAVLGAADLLFETELTPEQHEYVWMFKQSGESLLLLINDILDLSKVEAGCVRLEETAFDLRTLVEETKGLIHSRCASRGLELVVSLDPHLNLHRVGDPHRLQQILLNLLNNAIKFTEAGRITLEVQPDSENESGLRFTVSDTGVGIPADQLERIFDSFTQADSSTTRRYGGTGLGLTITKRLIELMGGKIWAESQVGIGSTLTFTLDHLPARVEAAILPVIPEMRSNGAAAALRTSPVGFEERVVDNSKAGLRHPLRILIAEDNPVNQMLIRAYLRKSPYEVDIVGDGQRAVEMFMQSPYNLVLMDMQMPVMDGYTATALIRDWETREKQQPTPILALSASAFEEDHHQSLKAGCNAHLCKPIRREELLKELEYYLL